MDMAIAKEELFAPIMAVVCYDEVDEAVRWLNESRFGNRWFSPSLDSSLFVLEYKAGVKH